MAELLNNTNVSLHEEKVLSAGEATPTVTVSGTEASTQVVLDVTVAGCTFVVLLLTRMLLIYSLSWKRQQQKLAGHVTTMQHGHLTDMTLSCLPIDVLAYSAGAIAAVIAISTTTLLQHPLSTAGHSRFIRIVASSTAGHFLYRLTFICVAIAQQNVWNSLDIIGYVIGIVASVTVLVTRQLNLLAAVVLIYQLPLVMCSLESSIDWRQKCHVITMSVICLTASIVCMLATPIGGIVYCALAEGSESLAVLTLWTAVVSSVSVTFMLLYALSFIVGKLVSLRRCYYYSSVPCRTPLLSTELPTAVCTHKCYSSI